MEQPVTYSSKEIGKTKNREESMDILRAMGIIAMVMGHVWFGEKFNHFMHAFNMPMFFFVSGFFFKHKSRKELPFWRYLMKKVKSLLVPYLIFGVFHLAFSWFIFKNHDISQIYHLFLFNNTGMPIAYALWFLTALFAANVLFFLIDRYIPNELVKASIIIGIAVFGNLSGSFIMLPYSLGASLVGVGLMYIGSLVKRFQKNKVMDYLLNLGVFPLAFLWGVVAVLIFVNGSINMRVGQYAIIPLFWLNAFLAIIAEINVAKLLAKALYGTGLCRYLLSLGRESLVYVCLNELLIELTKGFAGGDKITVFAATMFLLYILSEIVNKTPLKVVLGQKVRFKELLFSTHEA